MEIYLTVTETEYSQLFSKFLSFGKPRKLIRRNMYWSSFLVKLSRLKCTKQSNTDSFDLKGTFRRETSAVRAL